MEGLIWVIIVVVVALVKGLTKLAKPADEDTTDSDETPPVALPRPPRPRARPQPQPRPVAMPPRHLPPPLQRTAAPMGPRPVAAPVGEARKIDADQIRRFIEQLSGQTTAPPPVAAPPVPSAAPPPLPPQPEAVADVPDQKQTIADAPAPVQPSRATQWAQALRDRQNVRNIVIAAEIIGPPRGESA
jgi:hypothetical protein